MGRKRNQGKQKLQREESDYDSDDPRTYKNESVPDPSSREFYYDKVDEFHEERNKIPLDVTGLAPVESGSENEEEVLGWEEDESDEDFEKKVRAFQKHHNPDDHNSDLDEDDHQDDSGPATDKWGRRKHIFYNTDVVGDNIPGHLRNEEEEQQVEEEREALQIQKRMAEALDDGDFDMDLFQATPGAGKMTDLDEDEGKVTQDLSKLSKKEKLEILKKESPEFLELIEDFKGKLKEVKDKLQPMMRKMRTGQLPKSTSGADYIRTKYQLLLSYCLNINFYLILKAKHIPVKNHPVISRILAYRKLINELNSVDEKVQEELERVLDEEDSHKDHKTRTRSSGKDLEEDAEETMKKKISSLLDDDGDGDPEEQAEGMTHSKKEEVIDSVNKPRKAKKRKHQDTDENGLTEKEQKALEFYEKMAAQQKERKALVQKELYGEEEEVAEVEELDADENAKRAITYQISKNKGLTPKKKKALRNPRVKHRMKFKKAKVRRKGQVREIRTESERYGGEQSGIRSGIIKSIKIK